MKEKLLALLVAKFKGVSEATLERIATKKAGSVTDETQLQSIADSIDLAQVVQSEVDSKITDANKKAVQNYETTHKLKDGKPISAEPPTPPTPPTPGTDEPGWFMAWKKQQEEITTALKTKLEGYEKKGTQDALLSKVKAKLIEKKVPAKFFEKRGMVIESEDQIETLVTEIEGDYTAFKQDMVNQGVMIDVPASGTGPAGKEGETLGKSIAEKRNKNTSDGVEGKKI